MSTGQEAMLYSREGNRGSVVALVVRHRLCGIVTYGIIGLRKVDEHPAYTLLLYGTLYFLYAAIA